MKRRRNRSTTLTFAAALCIVGCASGDDEPSVLGDTEASTPTATELATDDPLGSGSGGDVVSTDAVEETSPASSEASTADGPTTTTTVLPASPRADLPTRAPGEGEESEPVPTGPLPKPDVQLLELTSYDTPVETATADGDGRLFVVQQQGSIVASDNVSDVVVFDMSAIDSTTFSSSGEQGLLGLAFHPVEDLAYINFTNGDGTTVVAEMAIDPVSYIFDTSTYREVLTVDQPFANHNGGKIDFGPDGFLYIGLGDGGSGGDPNRVALDLSSRLGKILRINPLAAGDNAFSVPDDNPFVGVDGADPTIWSSGLRNPWKFSFDSLTGDLWIADVGQGAFEEVDLAPATDGRDAGKGLNFGWSAFEANQRFNRDQNAKGRVPPAVAYPHTKGNCSVSGGAVARESSFEELNGWYVYGDFCSGRVWALDTTSITAGPDGPSGEPRIVKIASVPALAAITEGPRGNIYAVSTQGPVYQLAPA